MAEWRQLQLKQRQKRLAKCEKKGKGELKKTQEEIVVQRMSSEVSGKQQKYTRIGPREFVPFEYDEMSFENIVESCQKYFAGQIEKDMVCDILAGERGPSCKKISQIPDMKVFYVRFIKPEGEEDDDHRSIQVCCFISPSSIIEVIKLKRFLKLLLNIFLHANHDNTESQLCHLHVIAVVQESYAFEKIDKDCDFCCFVLIHRLFG